MLEILTLSAALVFSMFLVIKSADYAIVHSTRLAEWFRLPTFVIGFLIVSVISILPETFIAVNSALAGVPSFGLGTLFGSNVADLSLVIAIVIFFSKHNLKVESKMIQERFFYIGILAIPILFGLNGHYSRNEGLILVVIGALFYFFILRRNMIVQNIPREKFSFRGLFLLLLSMGFLLLGAHFTVEFGVGLARTLSIPPVLIGMFAVGLGTTLPELFFSIKAVKKEKDDLALGDIMGTVVADATIVIGIVALINPFIFNPRIIYITGIAMVLAIVLLIHFMKTDRTLTKKEAILLVLFYVMFVCAELLIS